MRWLLYRIGYAIRWWEMSDVGADRIFSIVSSIAVLRKYVLRKSQTA